MTTADTGKFRGRVAQWRHAKCFLDMGEWTGQLADLPGWDALSSEMAAKSCRGLPAELAARQVVKVSGYVMCCCLFLIIVLEI